MLAELKTYLTNIADAIRSKLGTTDTINAQDFSEKVAEVYEKGYDNALDDSVISSAETDWSCAFMGGFRKEKIADLPYEATKNVTNMFGAFSYAQYTNEQGAGSTLYPNLEDIPNLDFSSVKRAEKMFNSAFYKSGTLKEADYKSLKLSLPNATNINDIFRSCNVLRSIELTVGEGKVVYATSAFNYCTKLRSVAPFDTSQCQYFDSMFYYCQALVTVPELDVSNALSISQMFANSGIQTLPVLNTSKCLNMYRAFYYMTALVTIPLLDVSSATNQTGMFYYNSNLTNINEIKGELIGDLNFQHTTKLTLETLQRIATHLKDFAASGSNGKTLTLSSTSKTTLDNAGATSPNGNSWAEYIADKGWTLK